MGRVCRGHRPGRAPENWDPSEPPFGWQFLASAEVEKTNLQSAIWPELSPSDRGIPFTCESRLEPQIFRVLLLHHLWCPLPLSSHSCRCGRLLDARGHHRAACGRAGVLGRRGFPLESAATSLPGGRWAGAWPILISFHMTGSTTGRLRSWLTDCRCSMELNLPLMLPSCPLFEQSARRQCADLDGAALHQARQRKATTCPELAHPRVREDPLGDVRLRSRGEMV